MVKPELFLLPVTVEDASLIARWFNYKNNIRYMSTAVRCRQHSKKSLEKYIREHDPSSERSFMIMLPGHSQPVGYVGIDSLDLHDKRGEVFFLIERQHQGKGYGSRAVRLLLNYAFGCLHLNSLFATAAVENHSSLRILKKNGFRKIGLRRDYNFINGRFVNEVFFDLTAKDYYKTGERLFGLFSRKLYK